MILFWLFLVADIIAAAFLGAALHDLLSKKD